MHTDVIQAPIDQEKIIETGLISDEKERLLNILQVIMRENSEKINKLFGDMAIPEIQAEIKKIRTQFFQVVKCSEETKDSVNEIIDFLKAEIVNAPELSFVHGFALRKITYDDNGREEDIVNILNCSLGDDDFSENIRSKISLLKTDKLLVQISLQNQPTLIHFDDCQENFTGHFPCKKATPENYLTFSETQENGYREILCIPLKNHFANFGIITLFSKTPIDLSDTKVQAKIQSIQKKASKKAQEIQERKIQKIVDNVGLMIENEKQVMEEFLRIIMGPQGDYIRSSIASIDHREQGHTKMKAGHPPHKHGTDTKGADLKNRFLIKKVVETKEPVLVEKPLEDSLTKYLVNKKDPKQCIVTKNNIKSILALPIIDDNIVTDVLVIDSCHTDIFTDEQIEHFKQISEYFSKNISIARKLRSEKLERQKRHDLKSILDVLIIDLRLLKNRLKKMQKISSIELQTIMEQYLTHTKSQKDHSELENLLKQIDQLLIDNNPSMKIGPFEIISKRLMTHAKLYMMVEASMTSVRNLFEGNPVKMDDLTVNDFVEDIKSIASHSKLQDDQFHFSSSIDNELSVLTNRNLLVRVMLNLFSNAQDHGLKNPFNDIVPVTCDLALSDDSDYLEILVSTPGKIIDQTQQQITDPNKINKIFEPNQTSKQSSSLRDQKHGQGLDIARTCIEAIGGEISVDISKKDQVSFILKIPVGKKEINQTTSPSKKS